MPLMTRLLDPEAVVKNAGKTVLNTDRKTMTPFARWSECVRMVTQEVSRQNRAGETLEN